MSPNNFLYGSTLSPDYGADEQEDLIWVPIRVPKGSCSPPASNPNFYQPPDHLTMQGTSGPYLSPVSWEPDATAMVTVDSYLGVPTSDPTMNWSSNELSTGSEFGATLELELQAYLDNPQIAPVGMGEHPDAVNHSSSLFTGVDSSGALLGAPDLGLGLNMPEPLPVSEYGSPVDTLLSSFELSCSPVPSGSYSPSVATSPMSCSAVSMPQTPATPALFNSPDTPGMLPLPTACPATRHGSHQTTTSAPQPRRRQRRATPSSPRERSAGNSGGSYCCPLCKKSHQDNRGLARHLWAQHPEYAAQTKTKSERAQCPYCEYAGRGDNLARHMKRHAR